MSRLTDKTDPSNLRPQWQQSRVLLEASKAKHTPVRVYRQRHVALFNWLIHVFGVGLRIVGLEERGRRNALDLRVRRIDLAFPDLPAAFDELRIMQLSDIHIDTLPGLMPRLNGLVAGEAVDLCVLTGDYCDAVTGPLDHILVEMEALVRHIRSAHGVLAVLGNHDRGDTAELFEGLGVTVLVNQTWTMSRGDARLQVTGTDDVHYFYTDAAKRALATTPAGFKIALIHSAELADVAADCGFHLYLAGHTHGGQISLPGGRPIITHMTRFRRYARGLWRHEEMVGYTSSGVGVSGLPVRFNTRGEVVVFTLRRGATQDDIDGDRL